MSEPRGAVGTLGVPRGTPAIPGPAAPTTPTAPTAPARARPAPSLLYGVKQVELAVRSRLDDVVRPEGITALQYTALTVLARRDGLTSAELARNSFVTPQAMADLVTALERAELIVRHRDPDNRRQLLIRLTARGEELLARLAAPVTAIEDRMLGGFDDAERARFRDYLDRARTGLAEHS